MEQTGRVTIEEAAALLGGADQILILTHKRTDGDTCGSAAGLCLCLRAMGKRAYVQKNSSSSKRFIAMMEPYLPPEGFEPGFIVTVDVADRELLPEDAEIYRTRPIQLAVDHHGSHRDYAEHTLVDAHAAAAGEIILRLMDRLGVPLDRDIADALYIAISTDTGCFRYSNTTADTLRSAARCYEAGADAASANKVFFETKSSARIRMESYLYGHMRLSDDGRLFLILIPRSAIDAIGATPEDMENLSSIGIPIEGVEMALTMVENKEGGFRMSARTCGGVDASAFCALYGGGGHAAAAGCTVGDGDADQLAARVWKAAEEYLSLVKA